MVGMDKKSLLKNSLGQSMVEYIMLVAVVMTLAGTFFRSELFTQFFGDDGEFAKTYKNKMEYSYRHGLPLPVGTTPPTFNPASTQHDTYFKSGDTRFFGAKEKYP